MPHLSEPITTTARFTHELGQREASPDATDRLQAFYRAMDGQRGTFTLLMPPEDYAPDLWTFDIPQATLTLGASPTERSTSVQVRFDMSVLSIYEWAPGAYYWQSMPVVEVSY